MKKGDQLCILRVDGADAPLFANTLQLVAALTALGIALDDECPYLETRELIEERERRLVTWTLKAKSECGRFDTRKMIAAWHDPQWAAQNAEHPFAYIKAAFQNAAKLAEHTSALAPVALVRKGQRFALVPFDATLERRKQLLTALEQ